MGRGSVGFRRDSPEALHRLDKLGQVKLGVLIGRDLDGEIDDLRLYEIPSALLSYRKPLTEKTVDVPAPAVGRTHAGRGGGSRTIPAMETDEQEPVEHTGRYRLNKFHARGGMGEIWVAEDTSIGRSVPLKKMRGNFQEYYQHWHPA